jgi:hypothetical protein
MVFQMLLCGEFYENVYTVVQGVQRWIVSTPLSVKMFS